MECGVEGVGRFVPVEQVFCSCEPLRDVVLLANASLDIDANFYPPGPEEIRRASVMEAPQNTVGEPEVARRRNPVPFRGNHRQRRIDMLQRRVDTDQR